MKILSLVLIFSWYFNDISAIFIVSNNFYIKNYSLARTKITINTSNAILPKEGFFSVNISNNIYKIIIKRSRIASVCNDETEILSYQKNKVSKKKLSEFNADIVSGYLADYPGHGTVSGYLRNGEFYGTILFKNTTYYVENIDRFHGIANLSGNNTEFNAIIYDQLSIIEKNVNDSLERTIREPHFQKSMLITDATSKMIYKKFIEERSICSLLVLLDNSFLNIIHKDDVTAAVAQIILSINEVNSVFRSTDFDEDGAPDNIGFIVKYFVIIESEDSPNNYLPPYSVKPISPRFYLAHFAQYMILREVCLGVVFTAQPFQENVLGVSYSAVSETDAANEIIGGICQRPFTTYMLSLNAVAVSYVSMQRVHLPQGTLDTCLTHELGHAFGCRHDRKSDPGYHKDYLMSSHTLPGTTVRNFQFSPISKEHLIMTVPKKGHCLAKSTEPFCGNGILELGEECDCGAKYMCQMADPCCIPNSMHGACKINRAAGFDCHPSEGICCSSDCKYENYESLGVDCKGLGRTCPCPYGNNGCDCGIEGKCLNSYCNNDECARIDAEECDCPDQSCRICCLTNPEGICVPSRNLTQWKLEMGLVTIKQLENFRSLGALSNITHYKTFCHGIECITLAFKSPNLGDYCIYRGKLGLCSPLGCSINSKETIRSGKIARNFELISSTIYENTCIISAHSSILFFLIIILIVL